MKLGVVGLFALELRFIFSSGAKPGRSSDEILRAVTFSELSLDICPFLCARSTSYYKFNVRIIGSL